MNKVNFLVAVIGLIYLAGCTTSYWQQMDGSQPWRYSAVDYYSWVLLAPPEAIAQERERLEEEVADATGGESLVQMAILLGAKSNDQEREKRALGLLARYQNGLPLGAVISDYQVFAGLWSQILELRLQSHPPGQETNQLENRIAELEREREELRRQIEALTSIEQQLNRREQNRAADIPSP